METTKQALVLLHGALGAKDQFRALSEELKDSFDIHTLDFMGHGGTAFPLEPFSIPLFASQVQQFLLQNSIAKAHFFGYSMGGYVAMYLAKRHPERVQKIITLATKFYWDEEVAAKECRMLDPETILQKIPAFAEQLKQRHSPQDWKEVLVRTKEMLRQLGKQNSLQLTGYHSIRNPCLLLLGEKDKMVTVEETLSVQNALPHAAFTQLPGTPHPLELVGTGMLASLVTDFLTH